MKHILSLAILTQLVISDGYMECIHMIRLKKVTELQVTK